MKSSVMLAIATRLSILLLTLQLANNVLSELESRASDTGGDVPESNPKRAQLPPALVAANCKFHLSLGELPNDRFRRKGGREFPAEVLTQGDMFTAVGVEQGRDLEAYDRLHLGRPAMLEFEEQQAPVIARAREFVWQHWRNHRRGYLTLTAHSVDAAATSHIFVEQESNGRWRVAWRIVRDSGVIDDLPTYYDVQWVSRGAWDEPGIPLAEGEQPNSRKHILEFRDICGDVESSL